MESREPMRRSLVAVAMIGFVVAAFGVSVGNFNLGFASAAVFVASFLI